MTEKTRPIEERIASLFGQTSYKELRQGTGGVPSLCVLDVAGAVGIVGTRQGKVAVMALETAYGSTDVHAEKLMRAWEDHERDAGRAQNLRLTRWGGYLAARELAGIRVSRTLLATFSYLNDTGRRENLDDAISAALRWLMERRDDALCELRRVVADDDLMFKLRRERREVRKGDRRSAH